jgi:putative addiction module component (TIGR02574 family)
MIDSNLIARAQSLPPAERLELIEALWDSLDPEDVPVSAAERNLLDRRLAALAQTGAEGSDWVEVEGRLKRLLP